MEFAFYTNDVRQSYPGALVTDLSATYAPNQPPSNIQDNNLATKMYGYWNGTDRLPTNVIFDFGTPRSFNGYAWWTAEDSASIRGRHPNAWTLYGSNDNINYTILHTGTLSDTAPVTNYAMAYQALNAWSTTPLTPLAIDASSQSVVVYNNPYNVAPGILQVTASEGSGSYTYSWTGATSSASTARIPYKSGVSGEVISVSVSDSFTSATKSFNVTYAQRTTITDFSGSIPNNEMRITPDNRIVANVATGIGSLVSQYVSLNTYTPPSGQNIATLAAKLTESINSNGYTIISFDVNKYTSAGTKVESTLNNVATYGSITFDIGSNRSFIIAWKNSLGVTYTMATYNPSNTPAIVNYYGATLSLTSVSGGRNNFTYIGPNSETFVAINPSGASAIPCFAAGTHILTPNGEKPVENLRTGDAVLTADGREVIATIYSTHISKTTAKNAPYLIPANTFGHSPSRDLIVSAKHAIQSSKNVWQIPEFCSKAKQLPADKEITYYHIELPNYFTDNLIANGIVAESLATKQVDHTKSLYIYNKKLGGFIRNIPTTTKNKQIK
jgi:hypothetical protein